MIKQITLKNNPIYGSLSETAVFDNILLLVELEISSGSASNCYELLKELEDVIESNQNELGENKEKYNNLIFRLKLASFSLLPESELEKILKTSLFLTYNNNVDLRLPIRLMFAPFFDQDSYTRLARILRYLEENMEVCGSVKLKLSDGMEAAPLLSNWLKDYKVFTQDDKGSLNIATYVSKNINCKRLDEEQLSFLKYVLGLYDWLRFKASKIDFTQESGGVPTSKLDSFVYKNSVSTPTVSVAQPVKTPLVSAPKPPPVQVFSMPSPQGTLVSKEPEKEMTAFEKRLSEISSEAETKPKVDLEGLKQRMGQSKPSTALKSSPTLTVEEIKREMKTPELPAHTDIKPKAQIKPAPPAPPKIAPRSEQAPKPSASFVTSKIAESKLGAPPQPMRPVAPRMESSPSTRITSSLTDNLTDVRKLDDLKKIDVTHLRRGNLNQQVDLLKNKIISLARANKIIPFYALTVFEESPLFKMYLAHGNAMFAGQKTDGSLTSEEFGAIADLRREVQKM